VGVPGPGRVVGVCSLALGDLEHFVLVDVDELGFRR
jgi:hypothetical protein